MKYEGFLFVLVGPSGTGKNTIIGRLLQEQNPGNLRQLTTVTTRPKRDNETEGREHFFVTEPRFHEMIEAGLLVEYQLIHRQWYYGTPHEGLKNALENGETLIADIDVFGAKALKKAFPDNVVLIFIAPPTSRDLEQRIRERSSDTEEQIRTRLERAAMEMTYVPECDYLVVNDDLDQAIQLVREIVVTWRAGFTLEEKAVFSASAWISNADKVLTYAQKLPCVPVENRQAAAETLRRYMSDALHILCEPVDGGATWYHHQGNRPVVDMIIPMRTLQIPENPAVTWQPVDRIEIPVYLREMFGAIEPTLG